jgi:hypothetical protein
VLTEVGMNIKSALKAMGYDTGDTTDLETFERARGLNVSATPDAKTLSALASAAKAAANPGDFYVSGMKDAAVAAAEQNLKKLGYDVGAADGVMDEKLADAIAKFKAAHPELANVGRYLGAPVSNAIAKAAAAGSAPKTAPSSSQALVFGEISKQAWAALFPKLQQQLASGKIAKGTSISIGSYGIDPKMAKDVDILRSMGANVKYTPAYSLVRPKNVTGTAWDGIPALGDMKTDAEREKWGKELGMRFRDEMARAQKNGTKVDSWMMDEVWGSASKDGAASASLRAFEKGVLEGLSQGRNGPVVRGDVYIANLPALVKARQTPEMQSFMQTLNAASANIVQEEYPVFGHGKGPATDAAIIANAKANASNANDADAALAELRPYGASLAKKLVAGMAPGYRPGALHGLYAEDGQGGWKSTGLNPSQVALWRKTYMDAREQAGVAGLGEFGFIGGNNDAGVVGAVVDQLTNEIS